MKIKMSYLSNKILNNNKLHLRLNSMAELGLRCPFPVTRLQLSVSSPSTFRHMVHPVLVQVTVSVSLY